MSLHIGRLSSDVRQPYLEHLFQKYGRCVVNLKDGYGFAVYDSDTDANRALRALHGTFVSGGRITVNWSKQQPRFSQGFRRNSRVVELSHRQSSRDGRENIRFRDSLAVKNRPSSNDERHDKDPPATHDKNPPESHGESHDAASPQKKEYEKLAEGVNDAGENIVEEEASLGEMKRYEGGTVDASAIERERWAEAGKVTPGDGDGFDSYEPYRGLDRQKETEEMIEASSWDYHGHVRSSEKWQDHSDKRVDARHDDKSRSPPTCYTCGVSGHIARYCPQGMEAELKARRDALNFREKLELRQRRFGSPSRRRQEFHVHSVDKKRHRVQDGKKPLSGIKKRIPRLSDVHRESRRHGHTSENMRQATKKTHKRSRSERSRESSLSSEPSKHFRAHSSSSSAHSSSKSSQPTQHEGSRSNINHHVPFPTSAPLQHKSSPDVGNQNQDGQMNSPLEDSLDLRTASEIKHTINKQEGKGSALNSKSLANHNDNVGGIQSQNANFDGTSSMKSNQDIPLKNGRSKSLKLTTNEVISALKRYRMETREVDSPDEPVEKYFGAARLWPWEIIYYRRLKKGPISTENYARRLEQNREFGIVDQYVRSSSGWWEYH